MSTHKEIKRITTQTLQDFKENGGEEFFAVPCLNDEDEWCDVVANWIEDFKKN